MSLDGHKGAFLRGIALFDENTLVSLSFDHSLKLWDLAEGGKCVKTVKNIVEREGSCIL